MSRFYIYFSLTANSKRIVRTWNESEFCQLHLLILNLKFTTNICSALWYTLEFGSVKNFWFQFSVKVERVETANSKRNVRTWNESEFCQLHLYKENHMNSTPFVSVSHEIKKFKVGYTTRTYRITSSFDTDCCWRIKK